MSIIFIVFYPLASDTWRYGFAKVWCNGVLNWLKLTCGVQFSVSGLENIPSGPCVIVSNHQSGWETLLFYSLFFPVSPILKKELLSIPFWGWALRLSNPIAIDRSKPREAGRSLLVQGKKRLSQGSSLFMFPEGKRSAPQEVGKFSRSGAKLALAAKVPLLPIAHNAGDCWPKGQFIKSAGHIKVVIGTAIATEGGQAVQLTEECENWIREHAIHG